MVKKTILLTLLFVTATLASEKKSLRGPAKPEQSIVININHRKHRQFYSRYKYNHVCSYTYPIYTIILPPSPPRYPELKTRPTGHKTIFIQPSKSTYIPKSRAQILQESKNKIRIKRDE